MQVLHWPGDNTLRAPRSVATVGVFDGVHLGHQAVLDRVRHLAAQRSAAAVVVTFDRHPSTVLAEEPAPAITSLEHRVRIFERLGLDACVVIEFSPEVAEIPAEDFVRRVFGAKLKASVVVLGFNSRFGREGAGDADLCRRMAPEMGFDVVTVPAVEVHGKRVSSTAIREAILAGDLAGAGVLLGRAFSLYGTVVSGDGRGSGLGYPTANLDLHNETIPPDGVYACEVTRDGRPWPGVLSVGTRPTFHSECDAERVVEVYLIGFSGDLYGDEIEARFVTRLRGQIVYDDKDKLSEQIALDVEAALRAIAAQDPGPEGDPPAPGSAPSGGV